VAQRLIRRLCKKCRVRIDPESEQGRARLRAVPVEVQATLAGEPFYEPAGCPDCDGSGYRGRTGIFEVLKVTDGLEELIVQRASAHALRSRARAEGMRTLRDAALHKVALGETSIAEVLEHTVAHQSETDSVDGRRTVHV
jgi:type II secretory ATPase GspE/PulE/Tfp pilus assembly ATPase PilB-like protein